jgi:hypothetical protein
VVLLAATFRLQLVVERAHTLSHPVVVYLRAPQLQLAEESLRLLPRPQPAVVSVHPPQPQPAVVCLHASLPQKAVVFLCRCPPQLLPARLNPSLWQPVVASLHPPHPPVLVCLHPYPSQLQVVMLVCPCQSQLAVDPFQSQPVALCLHPCHAWQVAVFPHPPRPNLVTVRLRPSPQVVMLAGPLEWQRVWVY